MFENVAALFFDLDGTWWTASPDLTAAVNAMLRQLGLPEREEAQVRTWVGNGMDNLIHRALTDDMAGQADRNCSPAPARCTEPPTPTISASTAVFIPGAMEGLTKPMAPVSPWPA